MVRAVLGKHFLWAIDNQDRLCVSNAAARKWDVQHSAPAEPTALATFAGGARVLVGSARGTVTVYDAMTATVVAEGHATQDSVTALHVAEAEGALFVGTSVGSIVRLDLRTLDFLAALDQDGMGHTDAVLSFTTVNEFLFSGGADASIFVWHLENNCGYREISMASAPVTALCFVDKYLWIGEGDGTVRVLDIYGEDDAGISCIVRKRAHLGPVRFLERVGVSELWSAPAADDRFPALEEGLDDDTIAVWDLVDCTLLRRQSSLPRAGLIALLVRERTVFERVALSIVDSSLCCTEMTVNVDGTLAPKRAADSVQNYSSVLITSMDAQLTRVTDELKFFKDKCSCSHESVMKTGREFLNTDPAHSFDSAAPFASTIDARGTEFTNSNRIMPQRASPNRNVGAKGHQQLNDLMQALSSAEGALNTLLTQPKKPCTSCIRIGIQGMVDVEGVVRAAEDVAAAVNMVKLHELPPVAHSHDVYASSIKPLDSLPYSEDGERSMTHRPPSFTRLGSLDVADVTRKDFEVIVQERDVLVQDLQNLQQDTENTIAGLEKLLEVRAKRIRTLEQDLEKAALDAAGYEVTKRRCAELERMTRQQVQHIEKTVRSFEPRLNEHVEHAYTRMAADRDQLKSLQEEKADIESSLSISRTRIDELERDVSEQRTYIGKLTYDVEESTREIEELRADNEDNAHEISTLRVAATTHNTELELTRSANSKLREAIDEIKIQMEKSEIDVQQSRESHDRVLILLKDANLTIDSQKTELEEARDTLKKREQTQIEERKDTDLYHANELTKLKASLSSSQREVAKLTRESTSITNSNRAVEQELSELRIALQEKNEDVQKLKADNHELTGDREYLMEQLKNSQRAETGPCKQCSANGEYGVRPPRKRAIAYSNGSNYSIVNSDWEISGSRDERELRDALEAAAESTRCTQEVVKELASTANAYKKAAAYHAQSQAAIFAILKRTRQLSKRKMVNGAQLGPVVDGLLQVLYLNPSEEKSSANSATSPNSVSSAERLNGNNR